MARNGDDELHEVRKPQARVGCQEPGYSSSANTSSRRTVLGRVLRIRNQSYTIVGGAPSGYSGAPFVPGDFWTAMTWAEDAEPVGIIDTTPSPGKSRLDRRGDRWLFVKGRLAPGRTAPPPRTAREALMTRLGTEYPATNAMRRFTTLDSRAVRIHPVVD